MTIKDLLEGVCRVIATAMQNLVTQRPENAVVTTTRMASIVNVVRKDFMEMLLVEHQMIARDAHVQMEELA